MLDDLIIPSRAQLTEPYSGMDSYDLCLDKKHFKNFPHNVEYSYNSRGFRDSEWPKELNSAVWCFGDSFTLGLGSPVEHTWPFLLGERLQRRCVNISLDGASNRWISRRAVQVLTEVKPSLAVIHWSFIHRDEDPDTTKTDEYRRVRFHEDQDYLDHYRNFTECITNVELAKGDAQVIHSFIPNFMVNDLEQKWDALKSESWPTCPNSIAEFNRLPDAVVTDLKELFNEYDNIRNLLTLTDLITTPDHVPEFDVIDRARDGFHYNVQTAKKFVDSITNTIRLMPSINQ